MNGIFKFITGLCVLGCMQLPVYAEPVYNGTRGQLLYDTHCNACHSSQIHWREQKLVTDWDSLIAQVKRWQYISGLKWSESEIKDVAKYLDTLFYGYKNAVQGKEPVKLMLQTN